MGRDRAFSRRPPGTPSSGMRNTRDHDGHQKSNLATDSQLHMIKSMGGRPWSGMTKIEADDEIKKLLADKEEYTRARLAGQIAPKGVNEKIWDLAGHFCIKAEDEGWSLATNRAGVYATLNHRLQAMGWLADGQIRDVHLDLTRDLMDDFFKTEIEWGRASHAHDQFESLLPEMADEFIQKVRVARIRRHGGGHVSKPSPELIERGERVRAEREAEEKRLAAIVIDPATWPEKPDWEAIRARAVEMLAKRGSR